MLHLQAVPEMPLAIDKPAKAPPNQPRTSTQSPKGKSNTNTWGNRIFDTGILENHIVFIISTKQK